MRYLVGFPPTATRPAAFAVVSAPPSVYLVPAAGDRRYFKSGGFTNGAPTTLVTIGEHTFEVRAGEAQDSRKGGRRVLAREMPPALGRELDGLEEQISALRRRWNSLIAAAVDGAPRVRVEAPGAAPNGVAAVEAGAGAETGAE
jgi:hypothetical protein